VPGIYALCSSLLLAIFWVSLHPNIIDITLISATAGRLHHAIPVFVTVSVVCLMSSLRNATFSRLKIKRNLLVALTVVGLVLLEAASVPIYTPPSAYRYIKAYGFFKDDPSWFRVFQVLRQPTVGAITMYTGKPVIDGWYDVTDRNLYYVILRTISYAGVGLEGFGWGDFVHNTDRALSILRFLGVKYIVIDSVDPVYPPGISKSVFLNVNKSSLVELVGYDELNWVYTFRLKEWYPLIVAETAYVLGNSSEIEAFYEIASNSSFNPRNGIFLSKTNDLEAAPFSAWSGDTARTHQVGYVVHWFVADDLSVSILVETNASSFVYIPVSYYDGLRVSVNGKEVRPLKALPAFMAIYLPSGGAYYIVISRQITLLEGISIFLSYLTLGTIVVFSFCGIRDERFRQPGYSRES